MAPCDYFLTPYYTFLTHSDTFLTPSDPFLTPSYTFLTPVYTFVTLDDTFLTPTDTLLTPSDNFLTPSDTFLTPSDILWEGERGNFSAIFFCFKTIDLSHFQSLSALHAVKGCVECAEIAPIPTAMFTCRNRLNI